MSDAPERELIEERRGPVLWLTIAREARRNAISPGVLAALTGALTRANADRELRAVVLTGAGDKAFCAGADLATGQSFRFDYAEPTLGFANLFRLSRQLTVPMVARVNGACMAGGMGLMAMCDLVVAAPHAQFGLPEVKVGVFP
nr:enoyl-CoA hydratase-related protein [Ottowia sp.]